MTRNPNQAPANPYDYTHQQGGDPLEQLRNPAGVIGVASELRNAAYEAGADADEIDAFYEPSEFGGHAGAAELITLAETLRSESRFDLTDNERRFVEHMRIETAHDSAHARVDFESLMTDHNALPEEEAEEAGVQDVIDKIQAKLDATTDNDEKATYSGQIRTLKDYQASLHQPDPDYGNTTLENQFMRTNHRVDTTTGKPKEVAELLLQHLSDKMEERDIRSAHNVAAYEILAQYHPRTPADPTLLPPDPQLEYDPVSGAMAYHETAESQKFLESEQQVRMNELREAMAESKIRFLSNSKFGKKIFGKMTGRDLEAEQRALESEYFKLSREMILGDKDNAKILNDPNIDPNVKVMLATRKVLEEQASLRAVTTEKLKDTPVAKVGRWVGKHKFVTLAGMAILVPVTAGGSLALGAALGGGMVAASKYDQKYRGLRSVEKSFSHSDREQLRLYLRNGHGVANMQKMAASKYDSDIGRERNKRIATIGILGMTAVAGNVLLPSTPGIDNFMHSHATGIFESVGAGAGAVALLRKPAAK